MPFHVFLNFFSQVCNDFAYTSWCLTKTYQFHFV